MQTTLIRQLHASDRWRQSQAKRLALAQAWGTEGRKWLHCLARTAGMGIPICCLGFLCLVAGVVIGINAPRGVVCFSKQPLCTLRWRPPKTIVPWPQPTADRQ